MANEKIRCKKCRKSFDPDLYSGLCPKCGVYNGRHMDSSALEHYISGAQQGEKEHRELHEKYDEGYEAAHPDHNLDHNEKAALLQEARESYAKRQAKNTADGYQNAGRYRNGGQNETLINGKPVKKSGISKYLLVFVITIIIAVAVVMISFIFQNISYKQQADTDSVSVVPVQEPGTVVFVHALLESPITIEAKYAGILEEVEGLTGKSIYGVFLSGGSEEYNFDARVTDVFLQYDYEGNTYYDSPMDSYSLEEFCKRYNIWEDDVLSAYALGNGETEEGYLFFLVDTDAEEFRLLLQTTRSEEPSVVLQEAVIWLEELPALVLGETEVE